MKRNYTRSLIFLVHCFIFLTLTNAIEGLLSDDQITYLPGYGEILNAQYSGYIEVNQTSQSNIFYWFIAGETTNNQKPLGTIVWLNGGPGCSSLVGLFQELGPYRVEKDSTNATFPYQLLDNLFSWTKQVNVLFIDQPVGTGFSTTDSTASLRTSEDQVAEDMYSVLCQFFTRYHPDYSPSDDNPFFLFGESYAGKYIPFITNRILKGGFYTDPLGVLNSCNNLFLKGIAIGDGLVDPYYQRTSYPTEAFGFSLIGSFQRIQADEIALRCKRNLELGITEYDGNQCNDINKFIKSAAGNFSSYDVRSWDESDDTTLINYLNTDEVRSALHVDNLNIDQSFTTCNDSVFYALKDDILLSSKSQFENILNSNIRVLLYNGQFDYQDGPIGTERWLESFEWSGKIEFSKSVRLQWNVNNEVAGYVRSYDNLSFLVVNNAGHFVPHDQPENSLDMLVRFVTDEPFSEDNPNSFNDQLCTYLSNCGNDVDPKRGNCVDGRCVCNFGFTGLDCSYLVNILHLNEGINNVKNTLLPLTWIFYKLDIDSNSNLSFNLKTNNSQNSVFSLYLNENDTPSTSEFVVASRTNPFNTLFIGASLTAGTWYIGIYNEIGGTREFNLTVSYDHSFNYPSSNNDEKSMLSWAVSVLSLALVVILVLWIVTSSYALWRSTQMKKTVHVADWQSEL